ncbi:MAG: tetratricopeptide repeat protein [Woeseiaceae bacterium]|nr:tetratricopeptide repeat protein [Woeseiaceae bacterium]
MNLPSRLYQQLKRRGVFRAAIAYVVGAWALVEGAGVLGDAFDTPDVLMPVLFVVLAIGLPAVLTFSWFFDVTFDGIRRTELVDLEEQSTAVDRRVYFVVISLLFAALALSIYGNVRQESEPPQSLSILIADFQNEAGNELFSGIIEESLRVGLEVAPFIASFSRKRAVDIAGELGADSDELSLETAGRVALRESINIVIGGSVRRDGTGIVVTATGLAPGDRSELFSVSEGADSDAEILTVVANISKRLRRELGDTKKPAGAGEAESFVVGNLEAAAEYLKAQDLQLNRKLQEAVVHYQKAVELDPEFARAYAGLALTEDFLGRTNAANEHWEKALAGLSTLTERGQLRTLGNYYLVSQQDYDKALDTYERLVERYPADNVAHNNLAVAAFYAMDFDRAREVGSEVADRFPKHSAYRANFALYAMYASSFDEAREAAGKVIDIDPVNAYANFVMAGSQAVAGDLEEATATYQQMTGFGRYAQSVAAEGLADLALYQGDVSAALQTLDAAIESEMSLGALNTAAIKQIMRMDAFLLAGDEEKALAAASTALEIEENDPAVLVPAAMVYIQLEHFDAVQSIVDTLSGGLSATRHAYAGALRAEMASVQGDAATAISEANAAIELMDLWLIRLVRANVLLRADQKQEAQADLLALQDRVGEGIAVFLNDRPSFRFLRKLESTVEAAG